MRAYRKIDDHIEVKIEKGRLVLLGVGAGLTFLLVFLVGVLVGKGLWGGRPDQVAAAPSEAQPQEPQKPQYTFYDDLKRPDSTAPKAMTPPAEPKETVGETAVPGPKAAETAPIPPEAPPEPAVAKVTEAAKSPEAAKPAKPAKPETKVADAKPAEPKPTETKKAEPKPAEPKKTETKAAEPKKADPAAKTPAPKPQDTKASAKPAETPKPSSAEKGAAATAAKPAAEAKLGAPSYTVQVGSYKDRAPAEDQSKKISEQGVPAQVVLAPMEGRTWYRVQVGHYATRAEAEAFYQKKLRPKGIQGFVTQR